MLSIWTQYKPVNVKSEPKNDNKMKNKNFKFLFVLTLTTILTISLASCKKDNFANASTLRKLYKTYKNGSIDECKHNGQTVYSAGQNAYDAGSVVYDKNGNQIGTCNFAWGQPDAICKELTECETVYRVKDNIWGQPAVDKYGLGKLIF